MTNGEKFKEIFGFAPAYKDELGQSCVPCGDTCPYSERCEKEDLCHVNEWADDEYKEPKREESK